MILPSVLVLDYFEKKDLFLIFIESCYTVTGNRCRDRVSIVDIESHLSRFYQDEFNCILHVNINSDEIKPTSNRYSLNMPGTYFLGIKEEKTRIKQTSLKKFTILPTELVRMVLKYLNNDDLFFIFMESYCDITGNMKKDYVHQGDMEGQFKYFYEDVFGCDIFVDRYSMHKSRLKIKHIRDEYCWRGDAIDSYVLGVRFKSLKNFSYN